MAEIPGSTELGQEIRAVIDSAHDAFLTVDERGRITDWNPAAERIFGWTRAEALGCNVGDLLLPERDRDLPADLPTSLLGERIERIAVRSDGHEFPIEFSAVAVAQNGRQVVHAFLRDISERRQAERRFAAQHAVSSALAEAETAKDGVPGLLAGVGECLGWDFGAYWVPEDGALRCEVVWRAPGLELDKFEHLTREAALDPEAGLVGEALAGGEPAWLDDLAADPAAIQRPGAARAGLHAAVCLPIVYGGRPRAAIEFVSREVRRRDGDLLRLMVSLSWQIGRFFTVLDERAAALAKLESLALTDELTGLANRRAWDAGLERELARARRADVPLYVALLDLDGFKEFNDRHGHQQGDELLFRAAQAWQATVRTTDVLARYGGEEFALAFPADTGDSALLVVERLRHATPEGQTCSAGLARWDGLESAEELVGRADKALYGAKRTGRDRTVSL